MAVFFVYCKAEAACPRFPNPVNPDQVWQNDQDLDDCITTLNQTISNISTTTVSFSTSSIGPYISSINVTSALTVTANGSTNTVVTLGANVSSVTLLGNGNIAFQGRTTNSFQPAFLTYLSATQSNVTGNGPDYTIPFDTEVYDQASNVSGSTFTAPITGRYLLMAAVTFTVASVGDLCEFRIVTTARNYAAEEHTSDGGNNRHALFISTIADMSAADTAAVRLRCINGTLTDDILGNNTTSSGAGIPTYFSGSLLH